MVVKGDIMNSMLVAADPGPLETGLAFLFIAACIMGSLQDFLKAFDKPPAKA